jgi:predicted nucleic acid-binding protein
MEEGHLRIDFILSDHRTQVFKLIKKYQNLPMSLADACLVTMTENIPESRLFTFDQHFNTYRTSTRRTIRTIGLEK